jgi:hypothetical protein
MSRRSGGAVKTVVWAEALKSANLVGHVEFVDLNAPQRRLRRGLVQGTLLPGRFKGHS